MLNDYIIRRLRGVSDFGERVKYTRDVNCTRVIRLTFTHFFTHVMRRPCWYTKDSKISNKFCIIIYSNSQDFFAIILYTNMAVITSCVTLYGRGLVVRASGSHSIAPGSDPVLTSGQVLFPVVPAFNSTTLCKQSPGCLLSVGVLTHVSVKFKLFLSDY